MKQLIRSIIRGFNTLRTLFYCIKEKIPFDSTWRIDGGIIIVQPHFWQKKGKLQIGNHFHAQSNIRDNTFGIIQKVLIRYQPGATIKIGDYTGISGGTISASNSIIIGNHVMIGSGAVISDSDSHPIKISDRNIPAKTKTAPIIIDDYVFIGARSIILKGVHIGKGTVIGAGSVVTKNLPANVIAAGNPCKIIKEIENDNTI